MSCCGQKRTELKQNGPARAGQSRIGSFTQVGAATGPGPLAKRAGPPAALLLSYLARNAAKRYR